VPRIDLARIDAPRPKDEAGRRDLFQFGVAREAEGERRRPWRDDAPPARRGRRRNARERRGRRPGHAEPPPAQPEYIGSVENKAG